VPAYVGDDTIEPSVQLRRVEYLGETYVSLTDMIYLCEVSRDRFLVERLPERAASMAHFGHVLTLHV